MVYGIECIGEKLYLRVCIVFVLERRKKMDFRLLCFLEIYGKFGKYLDGGRVYKGISFCIRYVFNGTRAIR